MPEIDDADYQLLATAKKLGGLNALDQMYRAHTLHTTIHSDPKLRTDYEKLIKAKYPTAQTTADIAAPYVAQIEETNKRLDTIAKTMADEKAAQLQAQRQGDFNARWASAVKDHDLTTEGEEALAKFMQTEKLADPESAALLYYKRNPKPAAPVTPQGITPQTWGVGPLPGEDPESSKMLMADPERWADFEAANVLNEIRGAA